MSDNVNENPNEITADSIFQKLVKHLFPTEKDFQIDHDTFFKKVFEMPEVAIPFLKNVLPPEMQDKVHVEKLEVQNGILGDLDFFKKSAADLIYVLPCKEGTSDLHVFVILEHKSYSDRTTIFQLAKYCFHIMERILAQTPEEEQQNSSFYLPPSIPIIIHHGESAFYEPTQLSDLIMPVFDSNEYGINAKALLFDLNKIDVDKLEFGSNVPEFKSVLKMMQAIFSRHGAIEASEALRILRPYSTDPKYKDLIYTLLVYLFKCNKHVSKEEYNQIIHNETIVSKGEAEMSSLLEEYFNESLEKGMKQGMEQGMEQGMKKGSIQTMKASVLQVLTLRFKNVPQDIQDSINDKNDLVVLQSLLESAILAQSIDDFVKDL